MTGNPPTGDPATGNPITGGAERGSAVVETAIIIGLLLVLVLGAVEVGFAFRDSTVVTAASREGARIAGATGTRPTPTV